MASKVEICNVALSYLGVGTISALTDPTQEARKCSIFYDFCRRKVLEAHPWDFAERREYLALLDDITPTGYEYAYVYPTDCLRALEIYRPTTGIEPIDFKIVYDVDNESRMIITDEEDAVLIYTSNIENPTLFSTSFQEALSSLMAATMAVPLTGKGALADAYQKAYYATISAAATHDAQQSRTNTIKITNRYISARS